MKNLYFVILIALVACGSDQSEEITMWVGPQKVDCVGVGPTKCMQVRFSPKGEWANFHNEIEGFKHKKGHNFKLIVNVVGDRSLPADDPALRYVLVRIEQDYTGSAPGQSTYEARPDLYTKKWRLKSYTVDGVIKKVTAKYDVTLEVDKSTHKVTGKAGCNTFFGQGVVNGRQFAISGIGSTRMMCAEADIMDLETAYLKLLGEVNSIPPNRSVMLTLQTKSGDEMSFMPDPK